jgi:hypothetical protein
MRRAPQPPFSPDLAPSDFYLFGKLKTTLMELVFENEHEVSDGILKVLDRTTRDELESVFEEWVARLEVCIHRGETMLNERNRLNIIWLSFLFPTL